MLNFKYIYKYTLLFVAAIFLSSCSQSVTDTVDEGTKPALFDVNIYALNKLVCDPMGGGGNNNVGKGVKADLYYLNPGERYYTVDEYINKGTKADQFLFFSQINVPTRMFSTGFPTETGGIVKRDDGQSLYEFFALKFTSVIKLAPEDEEGTYELALLSDDGAIWRIRNDQGNYEVAVSNDGDHPTRLGCSTYELNMSRSTEKLMQLSYYQGPRFHISVIPMWRKKVPGQSAEVECGRSGNNYFFNESDSSARTPYLNMLARGWKPLKTTNYSLPQSTLFNPCVGGVAPRITNFTVQDIYDGTVIARWTTDIPATSQLRYVNMDTGIEQLTTADNVLRTQHEVIIGGLKPGNAYLFQGASISETYGKSLSDPITLLLQ